MLGQLAAGIKWLPEEIAMQAVGMAFGGGEHDEKEENPWKFLKTTPLDKVRLELVANKVSKPGMEVKIRHVYIAKNAAWMKSSRDKMLKGVFHQFANQDSNAFGRVGRVAPKDDYFWQKWFKEIRATNIVRAYKHLDGERGGTPFVLNIEEMATLWHLPSILEKAPSISKTVAKRAEPPVQLELAEDSVADFMTPAASARMEPLPVEFVEPSMPSAGSMGLEAGRLNTEEEKHVGQKGKAVPPPHEEAPIHLPKMEPVETPVSIPTSNPKPQAQKKNQMPDALRVLLEPGVELEDVGITDTPPSEEK